MTANKPCHSVRMAVLSDLHASTHPEAATWVREGADKAVNPLAGLEKLVADTPELRADVLLCPGDLCDRADWKALPYAWEKIQQFAELLGAKHVIATVGNHDVDSRGIHVPAHINQGLLDLTPSFPVYPGGDCVKYWDERLTQVRGDDWQVISLNSSLMEPLAADTRDHGKIDNETLDLIRDVAGELNVPVNVMLCHHHPQPITRLTPGDASHMESGDRLVEVLNDLPHAWMIVHGHRHQPYLSYMDGTAAAPTRLAAGSAGVNLWPSLSLHVRNQMHLVEFAVDRSSELYLDMAGQIRSWSWQTMTEWKPARADGDGLPGIAGFGFRGAPGSTLARQLVDLAASRAQEVFERVDLEEWEPRLPYLHPGDFLQFQDALEDTFGCHVSLDRLGNLDRVVLPSNG
jgi:predicted phosphodiesterase